MQAACAHAVPQVTALLSPGHAARPLTARTALLPARRSAASSRRARRWETRAATRSASSTAARLLQALVASLTARSVAVLWTAQGGGPGQRCGQAMRGLDGCERSSQSSEAARSTARGASVGRTRRRATSTSRGGKTWVRCASSMAAIRGRHAAGPSFKLLQLQLRQPVGDRVKKRFCTTRTEGDVSVFAKLSGVRSGADARRGRPIVDSPDCRFIN